MPRFLGFPLDESQQAAALREKSANGYAPQDQAMLEALGILQKRRGQLRMNSALDSNPQEVREFLRWALGEKKYPLPPLVRKILCIKRTLIKDGMTSVKTSSALRLNESNLLVEIDKMLKEDGMKNPDTECATVGGAASANVSNVSTATNAAVNAATNDCPNLCETVNDIKTGVDKLVANMDSDAFVSTISASITIPDLDADALASTISATIMMPEMDADALASTISATIVVPEMDADALASTISATIVMPELDAYTLTSTISATIVMPGLDADALASTIAASIVVPPAGLDADALASTIAASIVVPDTFADTLVLKMKTEGGFATSANIQTLSETIVASITESLTTVAMKVDGMQQVQEKLAEILTKIDSVAPTAQISEIKTSLSELLAKYTSLTASIQGLGSPTPVAIPNISEIKNVLEALNAFSATTASSLSDLSAKIDELPASLSSLKEELLAALSASQTADVGELKVQLESITRLLEQGQGQSADVSEIKTMLTEQKTSLDNILGLLKNTNGETLFVAINRVMEEIATVKSAAQSSTTATKELLERILAGVSNTSVHDRIIEILESHTTETADYLAKLDAIEASIRGLEDARSTDDLRAAISELGARFDEIQARYDEHVQTILAKISETKPHETELADILSALQYLVDDGGKKNGELAGIREEIQKLADGLPGAQMTGEIVRAVSEAVSEAVNRSIDTKIVGKLDRIAQQSSEGLEILQKLQSDIESVMNDLNALSQSIGTIRDNTAIDTESSALYTVYNGLYQTVYELKNEIAGLASQCGQGDCSKAIDAVRAELGNLKSMFLSLDSQHKSLATEMSRIAGFDRELKAQRDLIGELGRKLDTISSRVSAAPAAVDTSAFVREIQNLKNEIAAAQTRCCEEVLARLRNELFGKFEELKRLIQSPGAPVATPAPRYQEPEPAPAPYVPPKRTESEQMSETCSADAFKIKGRRAACIAQAVLKPNIRNEDFAKFNDFLTGLYTGAATKRSLSGELGEYGKISTYLKGQYSGKMRELYRLIQQEGVSDEMARSIVKDFFETEAKKVEIKWRGGTRKQKKNMSLKRRRRITAEE